MLVLLCSLHMKSVTVTPARSRGAQQIAIPMLGKLENVLHDLPLCPCLMVALNEVSQHPCWLKT